MIGYRALMKYLMLMWGEVDATTGGEQDFQAWVDFDAQTGPAPARSRRST
jgi:hypothetical protein